jgi:citrate lyase gamma subunit
VANLSVRRRHPLYDEWNDTSTFLWTSYVGGRPYHEATDPPFLDKYPRELQTVFTARQQRAYLMNYFASIIDAYVASVFQRDPVRTGAEESTDLSPGMQEFIEDATGEGTHLNEFSRDVATFALAAQRAFVGVDINAGGNPYAYLIHPANLLDFSEDEDGLLQWAIVAEQITIDDDPYLERVEETRYRLWLPSESVLFDEQGVEIDRQTNGAGMIPIIGVPGESVRLPVYDIARTNKRHYNMGSQLDEILINVTFPQLYIQSGEEIQDVTGEAISPDVSPIAIGTSRILELPTESSMPPGYLAPPDGPAKLHIEMMEKLVDHMRSLAGLERRDPDAIAPQSGVAKAYDFRETNERLVSLAQVVEEFENEMFRVLNDYGIAGEVNSSYNKEFQVKDEQIMVDTFEKVAVLPLPAVVKKRGALDVSMVIAEEATEEEKQEIREAVEAMTEFDAPPPGAEANGNGAVPPSGVANGQPGAAPRLADLLGGAVVPPNRSRRFASQPGELTIRPRE